MKRTRRARRSKGWTPEDLERRQARAMIMVGDLAIRAGSHRPAPTDAPEAAVGGFGSLAFSFPAVEGDRTHDPWSGPLIARLDPPGGPDGDRLSVEDEAEWYHFAGEHGLTSPPILAVVPATDTDSGALVMTAPTETSFIERIGDPTQAADVLTMLGAIHARIHQLPFDQAPGPVLDVGEVLEALSDEIDAAGEHAERDPALEWLATHQPDSGPAVVCHGEVHPSAVRLLDDDPEGTAPIVTNWTRATLADPEYDLGRTLVTLWASPYVATSRLDRSLMMMIRDGMLETYRTGYTSVGTIDEDRLRFWQTYHARFYAARARSTPHPDPWDPLAVVPHLTPLRRGLNERAAELTRSFQR